MHPSKEILERFVNQLLENKTHVDETQKHLDACEFCREYCEQYEQFLKLQSAASDLELPADAASHSNKIYQDAIRGKIISLKPLLSEIDVSHQYLAADGRNGEEAKVQNLATLYSEKPEVILRIMRDLDRGYDYLQLISDEPDLSANVMIQLPEINRDFITDEIGQARLDNVSVEKMENLKWQIRMPEATFALEPLEYDPESVEYSKEMVLETERGDKIGVTFEGKTEGKQISIQILEIDGKSNFESVQVNISSESVSDTKSLSPEGTVSFGPIKPSEKINIRLFQS
jgi:hypothetical protein